MAAERTSNSTDGRQHVTVSYAGFNRPWAAWIGDRLELRGHQVVYQRWDPADEVSLRDALRDLLLAEGRVLLVLSDWYFQLGVRTSTEWNTALREVVAPHSERFAAVSVTTAALPTATTVLGAAELWGVGAREAERRLACRLGLTLDDVPRSAAARERQGARFPHDQPRVWRGVPHRNVRFTGREQVLNELYQLLHQADPGAAPVTLLGMSGVGKTQVAAEYVHRFGSAYDVVWWVQADQRGILRQQLAALAPALGLTTGPEYGERLRVLRDALRRGEPYARWLVVFDGADQPERIAELLPSGPGHVLITSQNREWGDYHTLPLELPVYARDESVAFVRRRASRIGAAEAGMLAEVLGDLPLALDQTAGALSDADFPVARYIDDLRSGADVEGTLKLSPDFDKSYHLTFSLLVNRLRETVPEAVDLLRLCTFFAPGPIPLHLLRELPTTGLPERLAVLIGDTLRWNRALTKLVQYSVVRWGGPANESESEEDNDVLHLHRMVHQRVRADMPEGDQETFAQAVCTALTLANPRRPTDTRLWPRFAELIPHLEPSGAMYSTDAETQRLMLDCIRYLYLSGEYQTGIQLAERTEEAWREVLGEDHPQLWNLASQYAAVVRSTGDYTRAAEIDQSILTYLRRQDDPRDFARLQAISGLAADLRGLARYEESFDRSREELAGYTALLGEEDSLTLNARNNLAVSLRLLGRYTEALELDRETLRVRREKLGHRHNWSLLSEHNYALDLRLLGRYEEAFSVQEPSVEVHRAVMGPDNPQTLWSELNLAMCHHRRGDRAPAQALLKHALGRSLRVLGEKSPVTLQLAASYACVHRMCGDLTEARELGETTMERYRALLGPGHPYAVGTAVNHALVLRALGELEQSSRLEEDGLVAMTAALGRDHPWTLGTAVNVSAGRNRNGDLEGAAELSRDTARRAVAALGPHHPLTLSSQIALSADLRGLRHRAEADALEHTVIAALTDALGPHHPHTRSARSRTRPFWDLEPMAT